MKKNPYRVYENTLDRHAIMRDNRLREDGGEKILNRQVKMTWDFPESAQDIVAMSRRDMLKDEAYRLQSLLSSLRTLERRIDSAARSLLVIAYGNLRKLEEEEKRGEEAHGKAEGSTQTR